MSDRPPPVHRKVSLHHARSVGENAGQSAPARASSLPSHCSRGQHAQATDERLFFQDDIAIGAFRCPTTAPNFRDTGPIERDIVVFPRTAVRLQMEAAPAFTADPSVVTIYNRDQRYERTAIASDGDRCDWFSVDAATARALVAEFSPADAERARPLRYTRTTGTPALYARQRQLFHRARAGALEVDEGVEAIMELFAAVLQRAYAAATHPHAPRATPESRQRASSSATRRHRELAEAARAEIARDPSRAESPAAIGARLGVSAFHLCRVFRAHTGRTMHAYRSELRVFRALEWLDPALGTRSLSEVALANGFASHAHFVKATRSHFGLTPGELRGRLVAR